MQAGDELFKEIIDKTYQRVAERKPCKTISNPRTDTQSKPLKNTRWSDEHLALFVTFAFKTMIASPISFQKGRPYVAFDRNLSQFICEKLYLEKLGIRVKSQKFKEGLARRSKSKYNSFKRQYKLNPEGGDFQKIMEMEAHKILMEGTNLFCEELRQTLHDWRQKQHKLKPDEDSCMDSQDWQRRFTEFSSHSSKL